MTVIRRLVAVSAICAAVVAVAPLPAQASSATYVVEPGDYLLGIAREHDVSLGALLQANELSAEAVIFPGERLVIPGGGAANAPSPNAPSPPASGNPPSALSYTVVSGDALSTIAHRHGVGLSSLLQVNGLEMTSLIMPGQQLEIPAGGTAPETAPRTEPEAPAPSGGGSALTYTVVAGDALSIIAARHGVSLSALLQTSGLTLDSVIMPGQQLQLPAHATAPEEPPAAPVDAPSASSSPLETVVNYARAQVGKPYLFFTKGPDTFDCSGLTLAAYAQAGVSLVHYSAAQATQGSAVDFENEPIQAGDLVFQKRRGSKTINHVGIAISSTTWIHATGPGDTVSMGQIPDKSTIAEVRRYLDG